MAAPILLLFNKFGYCKFGETCRKHHINQICDESSCEINACKQRHPQVCRYFQKYGRCKFSPCAFKHEVFIDHNEKLEKDIKDLSDKIHFLEEIIMTKEKTIDEITANLLKMERKQSENSRGSNTEAFEEKVEAFEKKLIEKIDEKLEAFQNTLFENIKESIEVYSKHMHEACTSIDDMVVELNDDIGNITFESEDSSLLKTFDNPFKFKCNICEFAAKSDRGLKTHKSRKHENCDWCEFICAEESEMKKHKMDKHTIEYSKEVLEGFIAKSPR